MPEIKTEPSLNKGAKRVLTKPCPICGKPAFFETRPFCSKRCADIDLHRWLGGTYAIPAAEGDEKAEAEDQHKN